VHAGALSTPGAGAGPARRPPRTGATSTRRLLAVFAVVLLVPVLALGLALDHVHRSATAERTLDDARSSARLLAQASVQPAVAGRDLERGLDISEVADLGASVDAAVRDGRVVALSLVSPDGSVVFPPQDVGRRPNDPELDAVLADPRREAPASLTTAALPGWLGGATVRAVSVHTPVVAPSDGRLIGVLHVLLPHEAVALRVAEQSRTFVAVLLGGLAGLYAVVAGLTAVVTRRLRLQLDETDHQAHHDPLTGLPNRSLFRKRAQAALGDGRRDVVVALVDLDRFKLVNDTLGHAAGDVLLQTVAQRLAEAVRTDDTVARLGGDEFGLVLPGVTVGGARTVIARVQAALHEPCRVGDDLLPVSGSLGLAAAPGHGTTVEGLLRHADAAMYAAKRAGHGGLAVGPADVAAATAPVAGGEGAGLLGLQRELTEALAADELVLHYQPLVDLSGAGPRRVEALVRWHHPVRGLIGPGAFLPLAETTGQVHALTWWVLHRALADAALAPEPTAVSVNVPPSSLRDPRFAGRVVEALEAAGVPPRRLTLEMTESALVDDVDAVRATLTRLRDAGVGLSLDDFGQGSTSLALLGTLPFTEVKVDRAFVARLADGGRTGLDRTIVESVVAIAHRAGMTVVAEGVESAAVLEQVRELGCDAAQGFHLGRPAPLPQRPPAPAPSGAPASAAPAAPAGAGALP
jgi:diguanylate cyclase (GGDEF)-like protein